jgi:hypothetical protein
VCISVHLFDSEWNQAIAVFSPTEGDSEIDSGGIGSTARAAQVCRLVFFGLLVWGGTESTWYVGH